MTGDERPEPHNTGDRLTLVETAIAYLVARQSDVEQLSDATVSLSESTTGLESALREVGQLRDQQRTLSEKVDTVAPKVAELERVAVPRSRLVLTIAFVVALVIAAVMSVLDRHELHQEVHRNHALICHLEQRLGQPCR